jgi:hypothetical protein
MIPQEISAEHGRTDRGTTSRMETTSTGKRYSGRAFDAAALEQVRGILRAHAGASRQQLNDRACEALDWRKPDGRLKDMSCREALLRVSREGPIELPAPAAALRADAIVCPAHAARRVRRTDRRAVERAGDGASGAGRASSQWFMERVRRPLPLPRLQAATGGAAALLGVNGHQNWSTFGHKN